MRRTSTILAGAFFLSALASGPAANAGQVSSSRSAARMTDAYAVSTPAVTSMRGRRTPRKPYTDQTAQAESAVQADQAQVVKVDEPQGRAVTRSGEFEGRGDNDFAGAGLAFGGFYGPYFGPAWGFSPFYWNAWNNYWGPFYGYYGNYYPYYRQQDQGSIKLDVKGPNPNRAEVYVDGNYVGTVNDFKGTFHSLALKPGNYNIEVTAKGYQPLNLKVKILNDHTIDYHGRMQRNGSPANS